MFKYQLKTRKNNINITSYLNIIIKNIFEKKQGKG